jgi:OOP family OmpA-OmpF porin
MNILRNTLLVIGAFSLSGCTVFKSFSDVEALNEAQAVGSPFTQALASEYRTFANTELNDMFDYPDALHFARKGLTAASGEVVMPEIVADWNLEENHVHDLSAARVRLGTAFDLGARERYPNLTARAQAKFDCWIEQQEENWQDDDISSCKTDFEAAMTELESGFDQPIVIEGNADVPVEMTEAPMVVEESMQIEASEPMEPENAMYLVFFNWDSADISAGALNVLDAVADEVAQNTPATINVVGHADTSGPSTYNKRLAFKRANKVRDALVEKGVDPALVMVEARGEKELLVETPDDVREPANRRVNISFQ